MSLKAGSIFKARIGTSTVHSPDATRSPSEQPQQKNKLGHELTKNKHYCVSRLPALPSIFTKPGSNFLNAYSDYASNYSLAVNEDSIYVWSYKSADSTPLSIQFPLDNNTSIPLAILTRPANGTSQDPGLAIIDSSSKLVKFYESVQHAPTLGLINDRSLQLNLPLNKNEYITLAENIEPSGIVVATSSKRCILIQLRDYQNKPQLSTIELLSSNSVSSFFSKFLGSKISEGDNEIVSIRPGKITNHGTTQEIIIQDSVGSFNLINYNLLSTTASPFIDTRKSFKQNLIPYIENSIDGYLPGSQLNIQFLDIWPLLNHDEMYLALCYIDEIYNESSKSLMLMTLKINSSGGILLGSHRLTNFNSDNDVIIKPKLYLPKPGKTAFVIFDNSIIITDLNTSYIDSTSTFTSYYKPRWEDIIRLKSTVEIIGTGYEDQSLTSNRAVILITGKHGVLRIERFSEEEIEDSMDIDEDVKNDPLLIVKSHIEQGIFYSNSLEIDFDVSNEKFDNSIIISAIELIVDEILNSKSPYIVKLPSISDSTKEKVKLYQELIKYTERNFPQISSRTIPHIVDNLEKANVAMNLWNCIDDNLDLKQELESIIVKETKIDSHDILREFYNHGLGSINQVLTSFIKQITEKNMKSLLISILVNTLYIGVYLNETQYITSEISPYKSWIFETTLIVTVEEIFSHEFVENKIEIANQQYKENAHHLVEVLYYFVNSAIKFMEISQDDLLRQYKSWYKTRKQQWITVLLELGLNNESIVITEKYHDFASLARILDTKEHSEAQFTKYFKMFGFEFASSLYHYYLKNDKIQSLILNFPNYKHYLIKYFQNNKKQTAEVSWIRYLLDEQFDQASESLLQSTQVNSIDNLHNKSVKYSLAKLSTIAAKKNPEITNEQLIEIENQLSMIRYQNKCMDAILKLSGTTIEVLNTNYFIKNFTNKGINHDIIEPLVDGYFSRFTENIQLSSVELINLLTCVKPNLIDKHGFAYALDVAQSGYNDNLVDYYTKLVWLRLLVLGEDEKVVSQFNSKKFSDDIIRKNVQDSTLFKTLKTIKLNSNMMEKLDSLLANPSVTDEYEDNIVVQNFNQQLLTLLRKNLKQEDFKLWIESAKGEARISLN